MLLDWTTALAIYVWFQYGVTLLLSALATRFGAVQFSDFMFHWSAARAAGSAFASGVLWYREAQGPRLSAEPLVISRASFLGCCPPFITCVGYVAFTALAGAGGDISILSGLATLHGLFPGVAGLLCFKEPRTVLRLVGLLVAAIAIVLMGVSTDTQPRPASSWPWYARGGLFVVAICAWGLNDTLSSRIARHASLRQVMLQSGIAYLVLAACWAQVAFASASTGAGFGGMQTLVWVANFSLIFGWLAYVKLGEKIDASKFSPFVATYGAVPVLYGFLFLAEEPTATKVLGVLCSAAAAALSSTSRTVPWDRFVERYSEVDPDATPAAASARSNTHA